MERPLQHKRKRATAIAVATLLSLLSTGSVMAAGIEVSPATLQLDVEPNKPAQTRLVVANPTADVQLFRVYPDTLNDNFSISPASFTLESGAHRDVNIQFKSDQNLSQIIQTNISVTARPLADSRFTAATGVKVPFTATVETHQSIPFKVLPEYIPTTLFAVALMAGAVLLPLLIKRLRKKKANKAQP